MDGVVTGLVIGTAGVVSGLGVTVVGLVEGMVTIVGGGLLAGKTVTGVVGKVVIGGYISSC